MDQREFAAAGVRHFNLILAGDVRVQMARFATEAATQLVSA